MKTRVVLVGALVSCASMSFASGHVVALGSAEEVGMSAALLRASVPLFQEAVDEDDLKGAVLLVARRGSVVLFEAVGFRDREAGLPMEKDTHFRMASNTKPVVAAAILMLVADGKLDIEDLVRAHVDAWDNYRAGGVRIRHLLSHTSGLRIPTLFLRPIAESSDTCPEAPCLIAEAERFGDVGAEAVPGTSYSYNNPGYNTLGALIEITSETPLEVFLQERIYEPLDMTSSYNYETHAPAEKMSKVYRRGDDGWTVSWKPGDRPDEPFVRASGGMISTAWDYAKFCQMFLNGGVYDGVRLLSEEHVLAATSVRSRSDFTGELLEESYGFGWRVDPDGVYSHGGSDGTYAWVDPSRELFGLVFTQSPGGRLMHDQFRGLVEASIYDE